MSGYILAICLGIFLIFMVIYYWSLQKYLKLEIHKQLPKDISNLPEIKGEKYVR